MDLSEAAKTARLYSDVAIRIMRKREERAKQSLGENISGK